MYKQVDEHGNITYSNIRTNDAKMIDLPPIVVVPTRGTGNAGARIKQRIEQTKIEEQREVLEKRISEETTRLAEARKEYKGGTPDRIGSERNYQRHLNRVERLKKEIALREKNLEILKNELKKLPPPGRY
tara:strand:+ start:1576 stop:1965 length:390 start_codon:yes stop_codon:yes gene_type:complete